MKKSHLQLLGKRILPIVKRSQYGAVECERSIGNGAIEWMHGQERIDYGRRCVDQKVNEQRKENKNGEWIVFAVKADGTFDLRSEYGYEQINVDRSDFRIIKVKP